MHLVDCTNLASLRLVTRYGKEIPPYAALSHTWHTDEDDEPRYQDILAKTGENKPGYRKIRFCAEQARRDGLVFVWVDTCCIDKTNMVDLDEAINSMFDWYKNSARCYVYLSDVSTASSGLNYPGGNKHPHLKALRRSRWWTRGWTLQELLAPVSVQFFSAEGCLIGDKKSLPKLISHITGIDPSALQGRELAYFDTETRLAWAAKRVTKRPEDKAYSLFGIFGVRMTLHYGEGEEKAFARLQRKIAKLRKVAKDADMSAILSEPPIPIEPSEYRAIRIQLQKRSRSETYVVSCEECDVRSACLSRWHKGRDTWSGTEVNPFVPTNKLRFQMAEAEVEKMTSVTGSMWQIVYWQERRCRPMVEKLAASEYYQKWKQSTPGSIAVAFLFLQALFRDYVSEPAIYEYMFILRRRHTQRSGPSVGEEAFVASHNQVLYVSVLMFWCWLIYVAGDFSSLIIGDFYRNLYEFGMSMMGM